jgi:hypothetical protein
LKRIKPQLEGVHHCDHEPLHHLHPRDGLIDVGQVWRTTQVINDADAVRLVSHRRRQSTVAAEYGSPPEVAGNAGAGVGLYVLTRPTAVH